MNIQPMNDPRPGQAVLCVWCSKLIEADRETIYADLEGVPFKAYYHKLCLPPVKVWKFIEQRGGYYFWKYEDKDEKTVYNATKTANPPTNEAGYYSYSYILKVKGVMEGPTVTSLIHEHIKATEKKQKGL